MNADTLALFFIFLDILFFFWMKDVNNFVNTKISASMHGRMLLLVELHALAFNFTKSNTPP